MDQIDSSAPGGGFQGSSDQFKNMMEDAANEFLQNTENQKRIRNMVGNKTRLNINIDEVRKFNPQLANYIKSKPIDGIKMFEDQLNKTVRGMQEDHGKGEKQQIAQGSDLHFPKKIQIYYVNFEGNFGRNYVTPRGLKSNLVN